MILALLPLALARTFICVDDQRLLSNLGGLPSAPADVAPTLLLTRSVELADAELDVELWDETGFLLWQSTLIVPSEPYTSVLPLPEDLPLEPGQAYTLVAERPLHEEASTRVDFQLSEDPTPAVEAVQALPVSHLRLWSTDAPTPGCQVGRAQGTLHGSLEIEPLPDPSGAGLIVLFEAGGSALGAHGFRARVDGGPEGFDFSRGTDAVERGGRCYVARQFGASGALIAESEEICDRVRGCATAPRTPTWLWLLAALGLKRRRR